jgi:glycine betaine/proline transport system ATP-binding protein
VISAGDIVKDSQLTIIKTKLGGIRSSHELLSSKDRNHAYVLDSQRRYLGILSAENLQEAINTNNTDQPIETCFIKDARQVNSNECMQEILSEVASRTWPIPVVDDNNRYLGVVSKNRFLKTLHKSDQNGN